MDTLTDEIIPYELVEMEATALTDAEMRQMFVMVNELHAALQFVQASLPALLAQLENHPMAKMLGLKV